MAEPVSKNLRWSGGQAYIVSAICLVLGLLGGYLFRGTVAAAPAPRAKVAAPAASPVPRAPSPAASGQQLPVANPPEVAEQAAAEALRKLKADPNNFALLAEVGNIYLRSRVFSGAAGYYEKALQVKDDTHIRNNYGNALYYAGETERALQQYEAVLKSHPKDKEALFNRGMVRWRGKRDPQGAVESWKMLIAVDPDDPRRAQVEELIARAGEHARRQQ